MQKRLFLIFMLLTPLLSNQVFGQGRTVARLFWQDESAANVCWSDLQKSADGWSLQPQKVPGFPVLDLAEQNLVQMQADQGLIVVGIHDQADGSFGSGWVAIESGAVEESHGDHSHWYFKSPPSVLQSCIDSDQGNPAHVYRYGRLIVLANDKKDGFTITSSQAIRSAKTPDSAARFYAGGQGHITLAVVNGQVAYATWIAPAGDDRGRVDVVGLGDKDGKGYRFQCPSGLLHGATTNSGKVFFAPVDGVCWVEADCELDDDPESVTVEHLSLGKDQDNKPLRTGAFANLGNHVLFTAGKGDSAKLCVLDASSDSPSVTDLSIKLGEGETLTTPVPVQSRGGQSLAMLFRENKTSPENDALLFIDLDPNRDKKFDDLKLVKEVSVGRNHIEGHSGHHEVCILPGRREVVISNPADATFSVISLSSLEVTATLSVSGKPTRLVAIGG